MITRLLVFFLFPLAITSALYAQTSVIAYRSHSGNARFFHAFAEPDNLGLPPMSLDTIYWLSDTSVVEVSSMGLGWNKITDTVIHHPYCNNPNIDYDSMKTYYPYYVALVGFDTTKKAEPVADSLVHPKEKIKSKNESEKENNAPLAPSGSGNNSNHTQSSSPFTFAFILVAALTVVGFLIWFSNKKSISLR